MASFKARQIARIKDAVAAARLALRQSGRYEPLEFARVFVAHDGVQLPGATADEQTRQRVAQAVLQSLQAGGHASDDADVARELRRIEQETDWVRYSADERVVAFRLVLGPRSQGLPACQALLKERGSGLGPGLFGKYDIVVLPPECVDCRFEPVYEHDLEW